MANAGDWTPHLPRTGRLPRGGEPGRPRPALADYDRDCPEAALDLLRLIREAMKGE